jgi:phosphomannomutase
MISVMDKTPSEIMNELESQFGKFVMVEDNAKFTLEKQEEIKQIVMIDKKIPTSYKDVSHISYEDGCKVYFQNGDFVTCRFSGTEPLLRFFAESNDKLIAEKYIKDFKKLLKI